MWLQLLALPFCLLFCIAPWVLKDLMKTSPLEWSDLKSVILYIAYLWVSVLILMY